MRTRRRIAILAAVGVALGAAAPPARASIFFEDGFGVGRSPANGTGAKRRLVASEHAFAVTTNRTYVYWTRRYCCSGKTQFIGRARLDGSRARQAFITVPGLTPSQNGIDSVAVDAGHIYWTNGNVIGRANLDGSNVQPVFFAFRENGQIPSDLHAFGGRLYFRLIELTGTAQVHSIGRVDATGANFVPALITGLPAGAGLAIDGRHIYWGQGENVRAIARADLDGTHVIPRFIAVRAGSVAVGDGHIYWSTFPSGVIGRARIDGTHVEPSFVRGVRRTHRVAVGP